MAITSFRELILLATIAALLTAAGSLSADVSGPFLVDNVNQERELLFEGDVRGIVLEVGGESLLIHGSAIWSPPPRESGVWRLGTNETTARVDLPGSSSLSAPLGVTADGRTLFYTATQQADLGFDTNLFATDGTPAGTSLVQDIRPGLRSGTDTFAPVHTRPVITAPAKR